MKQQRSPRTWWKWKRTGRVCRCCWFVNKRTWSFLLSMRPRHWGDTLSWTKLPVTLLKRTRFKVSEISVIPGQLMFFPCFSLPGYIEWYNKYDYTKGRRKFPNVFHVGLISPTKLSQSSPLWFRRCYLLLSINCCYWLVTAVLHHCVRHAFGRVQKTQIQYTTLDTCQFCSGQWARPSFYSFRICKLPFLSKSSKSP